MQTTQSTDQARPRARPPSSQACIACRSRHVKCNGHIPVCKRCQENGTECSYKQSRRGYRGPRTAQARAGRSGNGNVVKDGHQLDFAQSPFIATPTAGFGDHVRSLIPNFDFRVDEDAGISLEQERGQSDAASSVEQLLSTTYEGTTDIALRFHASDRREKIAEATTAGPDALITVFYANFYDAHPFLMPRKLYLNKPYLIPSHLKVVMQFVASHFLPTIPQGTLRKAAENIASDQTPNDGYKVQGLILLGMAFFSRCEQGDAIGIFDQAIDLALDLGMNSKTFAPNNGMGNAIIEESWRRTWWELYMVDGILASLNSIRHTFRVENASMDVPLPCHDVEYAQCNTLPPLRSQGEFLDRTFAAETYEYSSMAYKIDAVRLLGKVISLEEDIVASSNNEVETMDASLANFLLSLPAGKRHNAERDGKVDEVLFMAHSIIDCALVLLHRPRSTLIFIRNHYPTHCTREEAIGAPLSGYEFHTEKAIQAANSISASVAVRTPLANHSPCFVCTIAMAAVVHLPAYALESNTDRAGAIKERLQLSISALNSIGEVWPSAKAAKGQIAQFVREIFITQKVAVDSMHMEAQVQEINFGSTFDDQSWLDELVDLKSDEGAMVLESANAEALPTVPSDSTLLV